MEASSTIELTLTEALLAEVDALAERWGATRAQIIEVALHSFASDELEQGSLQLGGQDLQRFIQTGIDAADRGDFVSHEEVVAWFAERKAKRLSIAAE